MLTNGHVIVKRTWRSGDRVKVTFPQSLRFEAIDAQTPNRCALVYGPVLLVALADKDVELTGDRAHPEAWIHRVRGSASDFVTDEGVRFRPLNQVQSESYTTYCRLP